MQVKRYLHPAIYQLKADDKREYSQIAYERLKKLESYNNLIADGADEKTVLAALGISRASLYRWKRRYQKQGNPQKIQAWQKNSPGACLFCRSRR